MWQYPNSHHLQCITKWVGASLFLVPCFLYWKLIIFCLKHKVGLWKICHFKQKYDKVEIRMFWSLQVTRDALCGCKKVYFPEKLVCKDRPMSFTKMPVHQITYIYVFLFKPCLTAWESPGSTFISMNVVWKGSKFQKSPPVSAWFMSSTFSQSLTKNIRLHFYIFPKFFHRLDI